MTPADEGMAGLVGPKCNRCNDRGIVHGIIDDDLFIGGSWICERKDCEAGNRERGIQIGREKPHG